MAEVENPKRARAKRTTWVFLVMGALGAPLFCGVFGFLIWLGVSGLRPWQFDGPSMEPAICDGDRILALPASELARGDVIVLRSPGDDIAIVKRVIAIGGDRIEIVDDTIVLNGERIEARELGPATGPAAEDGLVCLEERIGDRSWRLVRDASSYLGSTPEVVVPEGHVFVMGDHRDRSNDSRNPRIGAVPVDRVLGRIESTYWASGERVTCPD